MIYKYDEEISYSDASVKALYKSKGWCFRREGRVECGIERVPDEDITVFLAFEVDAGLVTGTAVGALAGASLLIFILIAVVVAIKILIRGMRLSHETLDVEMAWVNKSNEEEEETRIVLQMEETTVVAVKSVEKKLKRQKSVALPSRVLFKGSDCKGLQHRQAE